MNIQGWFPWQIWSPCCPRDSQESYLAPHLKVSILWHSTVFMVQLSHPYVITRKTIALTIWAFVSKMMSLLFNTLSRITHSYSYLTPQPWAKGVFVPVSGSKWSLRNPVQLRKPLEGFSAGLGSGLPPFMPFPAPPPAQDVVVWPWGATKGSSSGLPAAARGPNPGSLLKGVTLESDLSLATTLWSSNVPISLMREQARKVHGPHVWPSSEGVRAGAPILTEQHPEPPPNPALGGFEGLRAGLGARRWGIHTAPFCLPEHRSGCWPVGPPAWHRLWVLGPTAPPFSVLTCPPSRGQRSEDTALPAMGQPGSS